MSASQSDHMSKTAMSRPARLMSLDVLRGMDMALIAGGAAVLRSVAETIGPGCHTWMMKQTTHVPWHGYSPWDQIFPMFMFISGVAIPFALASRRERAVKHGTQCMQIIRRGLLLVLFGMMYNGLLKFDFESLRCASVLGRIGLGYMFAALITLHWNLRGQILWLAGLLLGYWILLAWVPVPGLGAGDFSEGNTWTNYVDQHWLPGKMYRETGDPEGLLSTLPAIATVLSGVCAGHWLRSSFGGMRKVAGLIGTGMVCVLLGLFWDQYFPINKNLWTSSFVLFTSGWSAILFGVLYCLVDVWGWRKWGFFFMVIGVNAITIYLLRQVIDFESIGQLIFGKLENRVHMVFWNAMDLTIGWLFLYELYRRKIFLRL